MEGNLEKSPQLGCPDEKMEAKYIAGLSTVLVATVQEAKDRISQIEYVFCSQLYPHFQAKSKTLQKLYSEARESAENAFKEKEKDLLLQIDKLQQEKQQLCDEISFLKLEREEFDKIGLSPDEIRKLQVELNCKVKALAEFKIAIGELHDSVTLRDEMLEDKRKELDELDDKYRKLLNRPWYEELEVKSMRLELANKIKEADARMELDNKLLQMVHSCTSIVGNKEEPVKCIKENANVLLHRVGVMIKKIDELQEELREKTDEIEKGRELRENLLKKVELQASEVMDHEQRSNEYEKEKKLLTTKLQSLEDDINLLRKEIRKKNGEIEEGRKLQEQLIKQIDLHNSEKIKTGKEFEELEREKQQLLAKLGGSEEKADMLQANDQERSEESLEDMELHGKLLQQLEAKDSQLISEKQKRKDVIVAYKKLKSQYNFLCSKYGLTTENAVSQHKMEDETDFLRHNHSTSISVDVNEAPNAFGVTCDATKMKGEGEELDNDNGVPLIQRSNSASPSASRTLIQSKYVIDVKSCPPAGKKRPVSYWRNTRSHQSRLGPDIHDDFLDTPLEKIRGDLGNAKKDVIHYPEETAPKEMGFDNSDDETQDMNIGHRSERPQIPHPRPGTSNFKYVEPVRKKTARENLKGIECNQCKKFYDAVLPTDYKEGDGNEQNLRCEHHDGVSRHRYRYAPPLTPEGFWNIGFESEM